VIAVMRPERLRLLDASDTTHPFDNGLPGKVAFCAFDGNGTFYQVRLDCGVTAAVHVPAREIASPHDLGERVVVAWNSDDVPIVAGG
jgi:putative spermidine/putrescine transport system ATP-binding protein